MKPEMKTVAWLNGQPVQDAFAANRALQYGDGVFRTCLIYTNELIDLEGHIEKIMADAARLDMGVGLAAEQPLLLQAEACELASRQPQAVLKMLLIRAGTERGYRSSSQTCDRLLLLGPAPNFPASFWEQGVQLFRSSFRLASQPVLAGIKHLNRLEQVLASRHWPAGADEILVNDDQGRPVSGTRSNLFWVQDGTLCTPALDCCGVAGLMRDRLLGIARRLRLPIRIAPASWDEIYRAQEIFVCSSLIGIWPVRSLEAWSAAAPGVMTRRLMEILAHPRLVQP